MFLRKLLLPILVFITGLGYSQNTRLKYANRMYENEAYYFAANGYEDVLERGKDSSQVADALADSYYRSDNLEKAIEWYEFKQNKSSLTEEELTRLALLYRKAGKYSESNEAFSDLTTISSGSFANEQVIGTENLNELLIDDNSFSVKTLDANESASEIGVCYLDSNNVVLATNKRNRFASKHLFSWTGDYFYDLYKAEVKNDGQLGKLKRLKSNLSSKFHDGPAFYSSSNQMFYFTRNNVDGKKRKSDTDGKTLLKIYACAYDGLKFGEPKELSINNDEYSTAHPTVSEDGKYLIFASDRPGGYGGMDLYYVELDESGLPKDVVVNLGNKINTSRNEVFPFLNSKNNILMFSSDGHYGLGGLDIFCAELSENNSVNTIQNLGVPINSKSDDFGFVNNKNQTKGYFSSNRSGGAGSDDIYYFNQFRALGNHLFLEGILVDQNTNDPIEGGYVYLYDHQSEIIDSALSRSNGYYSFSIEKPQETLKLIGDKAGYASVEDYQKIVKETNRYKKDLYLTPVAKYSFFGMVRDSKTSEVLNDVQVVLINNETSEVYDTITTSGSHEFQTDSILGLLGADIDYTFKYSKNGYVSKSVKKSDILDQTSMRIPVSETLTPIVEGVTDLNDVIEINPIYFDLNKYNIRPDAAVELDKVYDLMVENPNLVIELRSHTDSRGSSSSNMRLSDKRAKSSANYLISKGIPENRIKGKGFGESRLKIKDSEINKANSENEKERLHQLNRRTEFIVVKAK